jgi:CRISPR-associated exonuclease Cas4
MIPGIRMNHGHQLQLRAYFLLIEEAYRERPPYGWVVLGDGSRVQVRNTDELRSEVLEIAARIREHRSKLRDGRPVRQPPAKCRVCGQRGNCVRARTG